MSWRCRRSRAFVYTLDALIAATLIGGMIGLFAVQEENLDDVLAYQQAQDIMVVCSKLDDLGKGCFSYLREANPSAEFALYRNGTLSYASDKPVPADALSVKRQKLGEETELRVWH